MYVVSFTKSLTPNLVVVMLQSIRLDSILYCSFGCPDIDKKEMSNRISYFRFSRK